MVKPGQRWRWKTHAIDKWLIVEVLSVLDCLRCKVVQTHNSAWRVGEVDTGWSLDPTKGSYQEPDSVSSWTLLEGQEAPNG